MINTFEKTYFFIWNSFVTRHFFYKAKLVH